MNSNSAKKRCQATVEQLQYMVDFMADNKGLAAGRFQKIHSRLEAERQWTELGTTLNSLGGAVKSVEQWRNIWRELKSCTSNKMRDRKRQQALTGNKPLNIDPVTELEKRIVSIIGNDYFEGNKAVAENVNELQLRLEDGDDDVFDQLPSTPRIKKENPKSPATYTPQRKRRRPNEEKNGQAKFLEIAQQQADSFKVLAETNTANAKAIEKMAEAIKIMGEGLKHVGDAFNNLAQSINNNTKCKPLVFSFRKQKVLLMDVD